MRFVVGFLCWASISCPAVCASFSDAKSAYDRNRVGEAEQLFTEIANDRTASVVDRSAANRELARIAWLIDGKADTALSFLEMAQKAGAKPCDTSAMIARVLHEARRSQDAIEREEALVGSCPEEAGRDTIRAHVVAARLDLAEIARDRTKILLDAVADARKFSPEAGLDAAQARLGTALLVGDTPSALDAWKDYFWLEDADAPQALEKLGVTRLFRAGLKNGATVESKLALADLLMRAGFAIESKRFADAGGLPGAMAGDVRWNRLQAYWNMRSGIQQALLLANRRMAREGKTQNAIKYAADLLDTAVGKYAAELGKAAGIKGDLRQIFKEAYGLVGSGRGTTSGYPSIHIGHLVEDRDMALEQYGKKAKIHFQAVGNMIGNGFESWLWDGGPMVGGWQSDGKIVSVRTAYVKSPQNAYKLTIDSPERRELLGELAKKSLEDDVKLKTRPVATLEGLKDRLQLQLVDRLAAVARANSGGASGFRKAFLAEFSRANFEQSIVIHEGRHAVDELLGLSSKVKQPVLEYQAKLSELALATHPRMALRNLILNIEGDGPHDKAGAKLLDQFRLWMEAHPGQVAGFDRAKPTLSQLDKLTDGQLREIARGLDPLAQHKESPLDL